MEVWLNAPVDVCEARDAEIFPEGDGLYARARSGQLKHFTGVSAPFEAPQSADLTIATDQLSVEQSVDAIIEVLTTQGHLPQVYPVD